MALRQLDDVWRDDLEILEVGSGAGGVTEFLKHPVTGVDTAFERTAAVATSWLRRVVGTATALPLPDEAFDVVLCLEMLEHLAASDRRPAISEMLRVLRPGGRLVLTFPAGGTGERLDRWLNDAYRRRHGTDHPWAVEHIERGLPSTEEMRRLLAEMVGIEHVVVRKHAWAPAWKLQQLLFSVERGYPWTRAIGIHTKPTAKFLFRVLRGLNFGECYRTLLIGTK